MHRSRLAGFIIDCQTDDLQQATKFWTQALGYDVKPQVGTVDDKYVLLDTGPEGSHIELQKVAHPSRVHLDIESNDIEAEVARLENLGAKRIAQVKSWWVMEAPTGHLFCIVHPQRSQFVHEAHRWES